MALDNTNNWLLIGGPPCQAYSLVGRSRNQLEDGLDEDDPRVYLYREYYRILAVHSPPVFIMENVKGLLSSKLNGELIFQQVLNDLEDPVKAYYKLHGNNGNNYSVQVTIFILLVKKPKGEISLQINPSLILTILLLNVKNYGIPQTRHRVIFLGIRKDIKIILIFLKTITR